MTNIEALKERLSDNDPISLDIFEDILLDLEEKIQDQESKINELEDENEKLQDRVDELPELTSEDLGLDRINYYLEKGNLKVSQQLESAFNLIKS